MQYCQCPYPCYRPYLIILSGLTQFSIKEQFRHFIDVLLQCGFTLIVLCNITFSLVTQLCALLLMLARRIIEPISTNGQNCRNNEQLKPAIQRDTVKTYPRPVEEIAKNNHHK